MKKIRQYFLGLKEGFLDGKLENYHMLYFWTTASSIMVIALVFVLVSSVFILFELNYVSYIIAIITLVIYAFVILNPKTYSKLMPFTAKLVNYTLGRYGRVVTKKDWKNIKKRYYKMYKKIWSKEAIGGCYFFSWVIALNLKDAKLMYCAVDGSEEPRISHAVILKDNCVYCTNCRRHFNLEEYKNNEEEVVILSVTKNGIYINEICSAEEMCEKSQKYKKVCKGDIVYNPHRVNIGSIGVVPQLHKNMYVPQIYPVFKI